MAGSRTVVLYVPCHRVAWDRRRTTRSFEGSLWAMRGTRIAEHAENTRHGRPGDSCVEYYDGGAAAQPTARQVATLRLP